MALPDKLFNLPGFQRHYRALVEESVRGQFPSINGSINGGVQTTLQPGFDLARLMTCASVLAQSEEGDAQDAALRIAQYTLCNRQNAELAAGAAIVLDMLANRPAIDLAIETCGLAKSFDSSLPAPLRLDRARRQLGAELSLPNGGSVYLNRFQQQVRDAFSEHDVISVSAPTSAGKSFVLQRLLLSGLTKAGMNRVAYVVPTRALIQQTHHDLQTSLMRAGLSTVHVHGIPTLPKKWETNPFILVFTQERLQWLLRDAPAEFALDLVIVDEAQKIGEGARGILLEQSLADALARNACCKIVFCSPLSQNPDLLLQLGGVGRRSIAITSDYSAVNQNLLWASQVERRPDEWNLEHITGESDSDKIIGRFKLAHRANSQSKRLPFVAQALGQKSGNLVYVNGAADAEMVAALLAGLQPECKPDIEQEDLAQLAATLVHPKYALVQCVKRGVAFHYGNMPSLLRYEIERLFRDGKIAYLVCTSTLLEGVNLAAKAMFLRGPKRGNTQPMNEFDFWNLAGRAGRLGQDFQGNIICIDARTSAWTVPPPRKRKRYLLRSAFQSIIATRLDTLLKYLDDGGPITPGEEAAELDYGLGYLVTLIARHGSLHASPIKTLTDVGSLASLETRLTAAVNATGLPTELLDKHPGISPFGIKRLFDHFDSQIGEIDLITPVPPESSDAVETYKRIIKVINATMTGDSDLIAFPRALLVVQWMSGWTLNRIIAAGWKYRQKQPDNRKNLSTVIRETMDQVENFVRFKFLKYVSCYTDVLRYRLAATEDGAERAAAVPSIALWLEFGASTATQLALMALGLSRATAIELSKFIADDEFTEESARAWIMENDTEGFNLSSAVHREIERTIKPLSETGTDG